MIVIYSLSFSKHYYNRLLFYLIYNLHQSYL